MTVLAARRDVWVAPGHPAPAFSVTGLVSGYGQSRILNSLSLELAENEILAIMGRNGMGKSTLFKTLIGILPCWEGQIRIGEDELTSLDVFERVRRGLSYVPQGRMIFSQMSVLENIQSGLPSEEEGKVPDDIFDMFPVLYDMRNRKGGNLSGGQQQQLAIARALASNPKVLLLDEPTEGIQPSIIKELARTLKTIRDYRGLSIIVSEQVLSFALDIADRMIVIDKGSFVMEDLRQNVDADTISHYLSI